MQAPLQQINSSESVSKLYKVAWFIVPFLVILLLCGTVRATDDYNLNFIIPEETATPTPTHSSSGGGGGSWGVPVSANPPEVLLKIKDIKPDKSVFELIIKNEGNSAWEYIYTWSLKKINETTGNQTIINSWRASKYLKEGEQSIIPIFFENLNPSKYVLSVEVDYGDYVSKAHTEFEITAQQVQISKAVNQWGIWLVIIALIGFVTLLYVNSRKQQNALNRIIKQK